MTVELYVKSLLAVFCLNGCLLSCKTQTVIVNRILNSGVDPGPDSNTVTLTCRGQDSSDLQNPEYWLNGTQLKNKLDQVGVTYIEIPTQFRFTINRELEGKYSCAPTSGGTMGQGVLLIAYPLSETVTIPTITARAGTGVIISPLIPPGALLQQYFIDWINALNFKTLINIQGPRNQGQSFAPGERYSIDPSSFALIINPVRFEDRGSYNGVIGVMDPAGSSFVYQQTETASITLQVYVSPSFLKPELSNTPVVVESHSNSTNFTCMVEGYPEPAIKWSHDGTTVVTSGRPNKYRIRTWVISRDPFVVESTLTLMELTSQDSGNVTCVAMVTVAGQRLEDRRTFQLSVLGRLARLTTFITVSQRVILRARLLKEMSATVQLHIQYTNTETGLTRTITSDSFSAQSQELVFFDDDETLAQQFQSFTVAVALMSGSLMGPLYQDSITHDLSQPTELYDFLSAHVLPWCGGLFVALLFVVLMTVILCVCSGPIRKRCLSCCARINNPDTLSDVVNQNEHRIVHADNENVAHGPPPLPGNQAKAQCIRWWQMFKKFFQYLTCSRVTEKEREARERLKQLLEREPR